MAEKSERLLNLYIMLLAQTRFVSKQDIRRAHYGEYADNPSGLEAFEKAFERDKEDLRELGVVIEVGSLDGYFDDEQGYRISPTPRRCPRSASRPMRPPCSASRPARGSSTPWRGPPPRSRADVDLHAQGGQLAHRLGGRLGQPGVLPHPGGQADHRGLVGGQADVGQRELVGRIR